MYMRRSIVAVAAVGLATNVSIASAADSIEDIISKKIFDRAEGSFVNVAINNKPIDAAVLIDGVDKISMAAINTTDLLGTNTIDASALGAANLGSLAISEDETYSFSLEQTTDIYDDDKVDYFTSHEDDSNILTNIEADTSGIYNFDSLTDIKDYTDVYTETDYLDSSEWTDESSSTETLDADALVPQILGLNAAYNTSELDAYIHFEMDEGNAMLENIDFSTSGTGAILSGGISVGFMGDQILLD